MSALLYKINYMNMNFIKQAQAPDNRETNETKRKIA